MTNAEWQNKKHAEWRAAGLCTNCGGERDDEHMRCSACREKLNARARESQTCNNWIKARRKRRIAAGLCPVCGVPVTGDYVECKACRDRACDYMRAMRRRKANEEA